MESHSGVAYSGWEPTSRYSRAPFSRKTFDERPRRPPDGRGSALPRRAQAPAGPEGCTLTPYRSRGRRSDVPQTKCTAGYRPGIRSGGPYRSTPPYHEAVDGVNERVRMASSPRWADRSRPGCSRPAWRTRASPWSSGAASTAPSFTVGAMSRVDVFVARTTWKTPSSSCWSPRSTRCLTSPRSGSVPRTLGRPALWSSWSPSSSSDHPDREDGHRLSCRLPRD